MKSEDGELAHSVKYHILRLFTVLCEKNKPYFLDKLYRMSCSQFLAETIINEASRKYKMVRMVHKKLTAHQDIVELVQVAASKKADTTAAPFVTAREAFRVVELFSYDSNFSTIVIKEGM